MIQHPVPVRSLASGLLIAVALAASPAFAEGEAAKPPLPGQATEAPPEGLPTPDQFVRDAMRHPPADPVERAAALKGLYERLAAAPSAEMAAAVAQAIERIWRTSGSPTLDLLLARATASIETGRHDLAEALLSSALELQPDFAEAWNRRAFLFHKADDSQRALADLRRALALDPSHFRALEGMAIILRGLGEKKAALAAYKKLLEVYPFFAGAKTAVEELSVEVEGQGI